MLYQNIHTGEIDDFHTEQVQEAPGRLRTVFVSKKGDRWEATLFAAHWIPVGPENATEDQAPQRE